jgi:uncharacterized spore protein YtfJ
VKRPPRGAGSEAPRIAGVGGLGGARLCYGKPVTVGERKVIPVASVRATGGMGFGSGSAEQEGSGGGGGGWIEARPIGFVEIGPDGARFERIADPDATSRTLRAGAAAVATLVTTIAGVRAARRGGLPAGRIRRLLEP